LPIIEESDIDVLIEKNRQARRAVSRKTGKFSIPALSRVEKTSVRMIIMARGLRRDQMKPRTEFRYLSLNSLIVRFLTSSPY